MMLEVHHDFSEQLTALFEIKGASQELDCSTRYIYCEHMNVAIDTEMVHTIFLHLSTTPAWLRLIREERAQVVAEHVAPLLERYGSTTTLRWYDAEAFSASPTDIAVVTTSALQDWYDLYESLRDTPLWTVPYFATERIVVAIEQGFRGYEQRLEV